MNYRTGQPYVNAVCALRDGWLVQAARAKRQGKDIRNAIDAAMGWEENVRRYAKAYALSVPDIPDRFIPMLTEHRLLTR